MTEEILEETALAPSELIELFKHRSATYGLLSRLYAKEVDAELLDELHDTLSQLPLFPFMKISVTPLAQHPSSIA